MEQIKVTPERLRLGFGVFPRCVRSHPEISGQDPGEPLSADKDSG